MKKKATGGFFLFEVLIAMFITAVALLALAKLDVYILKSSQSSLNFTIATIRANNFIDSVWIDLCDAQKTTSDSTYNEIRDNWIGELSAANITAASTAPPTTYPAGNTVAVSVSWQDSRFFNDGANNSVTMNAQFPDSGCG